MDVSETRDLEAKIAEEVFGIEVISDVSGPVYVHGALMLPVSMYARSISDAWLVVERMAEVEWRMHLSDERANVNYDNLFIPGWACTFYNEDHCYLGSTVTVDTAPEAICRAALVALRDLKFHLEAE